jgi:hypothetical protein
MIDFLASKGREGCRFFNRQQHEWFSVRTNFLTTRNRILPEKQTDGQRVKKCPVFYVNRRFISAFIKDRYWSLPSSRLIQFISSHQISLRYCDVHAVGNMMFVNKPLLGNHATVDVTCTLQAIWR